MRHWAAPFVLAMLMLRALVPAGFMLAPVDGGGLALVLCDADATAALYRHAGHEMPRAGHNTSAVAADAMAGHDMSGKAMPAAGMAGHDMSGNAMPAAGMVGHDMSGHDMAGHDMSGDTVSAANMAGHDLSGHGHPGGHTHPDPTCPYAQSSGATPLPFFAAVTPAIASSAPVVPDLVAQTYAHFGPTRQQSPRGPPHLS